MLLCFDVYVWIPAADRGAGLARFMDRYVDTDDPGDARLDAVVRTLVHGRPGPGDGDVLADLRGPGAPGAAFSVYLRARRHALRADA